MAGQIAQQLGEVRQRVREACLRSGRAPESVGLVAVSKTFPAAAILDAHHAGQLVFGESRLQEAEPKISELPSELEWHFIGRVQRNKVRKILPLFSTVHGIDSFKLADHTNRIAGEMGLKPSVFLQVNVAREDSKGGFDPDALREGMKSLFALGNLRIRGLMCIPPPAPDAEGSRPWFVALRKLRDELRAQSCGGLDELSMGMSGDYEVAIEEGASLVRVGSAIFGSRDGVLSDGRTG